MNTLTAAKKFEDTLDKPVSESDGSGSLYAYVERHGNVEVLKIGQTGRPVRYRRREWDSRCTEYAHEWLEPVEVTFRKRVERLIHLLLQINGIHRVLDYCNACGVHHAEKFAINRGLWLKVIVPTIRRLDEEVVELEELWA